MPIEDLNGVTQYVMDLVAIFAFALSGAFIAVRRDFDIFGAVILSEAAGLGGGFFRDLVLRVQPVAFTDLGYFFTPIGAAALVYFGHRLSNDRLVSNSALFDVSDAGALGLFSVTGTIKALAHGLNVPAAVTLGCASAVGGGVLASLLALEVPSLLRWDRDLYALPALVGAGSVAVLHLSGLLNVASALGAAVFAFLLRLLALRYRWRTPRSHFWRNPFSGMRQAPAASSAAWAATSPDEVDTVEVDHTQDDTIMLRNPDLRPGHHRPLPDPRILLRGPGTPGQVRPAGPHRVPTAPRRSGSESEDGTEGVPARK
jgi:uncharacterized membrane protein YeiH